MLKDVELHSYSSWITSTPSTSPLSNPLHHPSPLYPYIPPPVSSSFPLAFPTLLYAPSNPFFRSFNWTFLSPPANYCPTIGVGTYTAIPNDFLPIDEKGNYRGIATSDLAIALADEAENQRHPFMHWTCWGEQPDLVTRVPIYLSLRDVRNLD